MIGENVQNAEYFVTCKTYRKLSIHRVSFMVTQSYTFVYLLSMAQEKPKPKVIQNDDLEFQLL